MGVSLPPHTPEILGRVPPSSVVVATLAEFFVTGSERCLCGGLCGFDLVVVLVFLGVLCSFLGCKNFLGNVGFGTSNC